MEMIIHNSAQSYTRPVANIGMSHRVSASKPSEYLNLLKLPQGTGRLALVICMVTAALSLTMTGYRGHLVTATTELEDRRHELMDQNITLRAMRASMMTPQAIERVAGEKLALRKAEAGQVLVFNTRRGRFESVQ